MKFSVVGTIGKQELQPFHLELEAKSQKHAAELAMIRLGSTSKTIKSMIHITKVEAMK